MKTRTYFSILAVMMSVSPSIHAQGPFEQTERVLRRSIDFSDSIFDQWHRRLARQRMGETNETNAWTFDATTGFGYDTNPGQSRDARGAGWFEGDIDMVFEHRESNTLSFFLKGDYTADRYTDYSRDFDADTFSAAAWMQWAPTDTFKVVLKDQQTWAYSAAERSNPATWNLLSLDMEKTLNESVFDGLEKADADHSAWIVSGGIAHSWFDDGHGDRTLPHVGLAYSWSRNEDPDSSHNWLVKVKVDEAYAAFDSGSHYWQTGASASLTYVFNKNVSLTALASYTNRNDSRRDANFDQWQFFPALAWTYTWDNRSASAPAASVRSGK